jgi:hypothetical protein
MHLHIRGAHVVMRRGPVSRTRLLRFYPSPPLSELHNILTQTTDCGPACECSNCRAARDAPPTENADLIEFTGEALHPSLRTDVLDELAELQEKFPLRSGIRRIEIADRMPGGEQNCSGWFGDADPDGTLYLNSRAFGESGEGREALEARLFAGNFTDYRDGPRRFHGGMTTIKSIFSHEYGHFVAHEIAADQEFGPSFEKLQNAAWATCRRLDRFPTRYALVNEDEWAAEAFAVLRWGDDTAKSAPGVDDLSRLLESYFR